MEKATGPATLEMDLDRIEKQAREIRDRCGPVIAVVKSNAYGLGARKVAEAIASIVDGFAVFRLSEAIEANLWEIARKPILALRPGSESAEDFLAHHARPAVWTAEQAARLRSAGPVLCVDTGMQRFASPADKIDAVIAAGNCQEAFTHAVNVDQAKELASLMAGRKMRLHAAASALLDYPEARLDAVRPGIALYRGAARVWENLVEVRDSGKPAGYSGFVVPRFGVILRGYSSGLRPGPCSVNGKARKLLEVGMQSAYVEIGPNDRPGDRVYLLGEGITEAQVAAAWKCSQHEALVNLTR
jgi:alanine racemase